jgi:ribosomal protein S21
MVFPQGIEGGGMVSNAAVTVKNGDVQKALRVLKKLWDKGDLGKDARRKTFFVRAGQGRRGKHAKAIRRQAREAAKAN